MLPPCPCPRPPCGSRSSAARGGARSDRPCSAFKAVRPHARHPTPHHPISSSFLSISKFRGSSHHRAPPLLCQRRAPPPAPLSSIPLVNSSASSSSLVCAYVRLPSLRSEAVVAGLLLRSAMAELAGARARAGDLLHLLFCPFAQALRLLFGTARRIRPSPRLATATNGDEAAMQLRRSSA